MTTAVINKTGIDQVEIEFIQQGSHETEVTLRDVLIGKVAVTSKERRWSNVERGRSETKVRETSTSYKLSSSKIP